MRGGSAVAALLTAALLVLLGGDAVAAASFTLTEAQKAEALRFGAMSAASETFDGEWRVERPTGESVLVLTPFHRLAVAARHAAFRGQEVRPAEVDRLLREQRDRLLFWVALVGTTEDFARRLTPELRVADRTIKPAFVQNERTAVRWPAGGFLARCLYAFPVKELRPPDRVSLVVRDGDGRELRAFPIELAAMR